MAKPMMQFAKSHHFAVAANRVKAWLLGLLTVAIMAQAACVRNPASIYEWSVRGNVAFPTAPDFEGEPIEPPVFHAAEPNCTFAVNTPPEWTSPPAYHAFVGADHRQFIIPMTQDPRRILKQGDILIYQSDVHRTPTTYADYYATGKLHCAVVRKGLDECAHLDAPENLIGKNFTDHPCGYPAFHILRLREYPKAVTSEALLDEWLADPMRAEALRWFTTQRERQVAAMMRALDAAEQQGYRYDIRRITEYTAIPQSLGAAWKPDPCGRPLSWYCSELIGVVLKCAGVDLPPSLGFHHSLTRLAEEVDRRIAVSPGLTRGCAIDQVLDGFFGRSFLIDAGATDHELDAWEKKGALPWKFSMARNHYRKLIDQPAQARVEGQVLADNFGLPVLGGGRPLSVADIFDCIYHPDSPLVYVGTYVGERGRGESPEIISLRQPDSEAHAECSHRPRSVYAHIFPIEEMCLSPDDQWVATRSRDETVRLHGIHSHETRTLARGRWLKSIRFTPDGRSLIGRAGDGREEVFRVPQCGRKVRPANRYSRPRVTITGTDVTVEGNRIGVRVFHHQAGVRGAKLTRDSRILVTACENTLHFYRLAPCLCVAEAARREWRPS